MQRQLLAADGTNPQRLEALGDTLNAIGCTLVNAGQLDQALATFPEAISLRQRLVEWSPHAAEFQTGCVANTYMNLGLAEKDRELAQGQEDVDLTQASKHCELAQSLRREILATGGGDAKLFHDVAMGCFNLASLAEKAKDLSAAAQCLEEARQRFADLVKSDPADQAMLHQLAVCCRFQGDVICEICSRRQIRRQPAPRQSPEDLW